MDNNIPVFIIIGHSNEGKSSIVSTLVGHDIVEVNNAPGTTRKHRIFPFKIDGKRIIDFVDTPGFENPKKILKWLKQNEQKYDGKELIRAFYNKHYSKKKFELDCELLKPISDYTGACILYVFDGSRPLDEKDLWAMEIVRLTGCSRIALINLKENDEKYLSKWKNECQKSFSSVRIFNAHQAKFKDRLTLLGNIQNLVQEIESSMGSVINELRNKRKNEYKYVAKTIIRFLLECVKHSEKKNYAEGANLENIKKKLLQAYKISIEKIESNHRQDIRKIYQHQIFELKIPQKSIINEDLFDEHTWQVLGLTQNQLTVAAASAGGVGGAGIGALLSPFTGGASIGIGALIGAATSGIAAYFKGEDMVDVAVQGIKLGGSQIIIGPNKNIQFYYILLDRMLLYYSYMVKRAHGKRDETLVEIDDGEKQGFTTQWEKDSREKYQKALDQMIKNKELGEEESESLTVLLVSVLEEIDDI